MKLYKTKSPQYVCVKNRWKWWVIEQMDRGSTTSQFCSISPNWNKIHDKKQDIFYRFISFSKSLGKMPIANPFILTVNAGRNFESLFTISIKYIGRA